MKHQIILISLLLFVLKLTKATPTDLTCQGVSNRKLNDVKNCTFVSKNSTDIECLSYVATSRNPTATSARVRTVFYLKDQISTTLDGENFQYCLGVKSVEFHRAGGVPQDHPNVFLLNSFLEHFIAPIKRFSANIEFQSNASVGFLKLQDECDAALPPMETSCISKVKAATFITAPQEHDFSILELSTGAVSSTYFTAMKGTLLDASFRSTNNAITTWLPALNKTHVRKFDASGSDFTGKLSFVFQNLMELKDLNLSNCNIESINKRNFLEHGAPNLEVLDLSENKLKGPPEGVASLTLLKSLDLSSQDVDTFDLSVGLRNLSKLRELDLSGLPLFQISRSSLPNSPMLEILDLSNCNLTTLPEDTFDDLQSLKHLNLSGNQLTKIPYKVFQHLPPGSRVQLRQDTKVAGKPKLLLNDNVEIVGLSFEKVENKGGVVGQRILDTSGIGNNKIVGTEFIILLLALNLLKLII